MTHFLPCSWSSALLVALLSLSSTTIRAQAKVKPADPWQTWVRATFPVLEKLTVPTALDQARLAGLLRNQADHSRLKSAIASLRRTQRLWSNPQMLIDLPTTKRVAIANDSIAYETEHNDGSEYADDAAGHATAVGSNGFIDDISDYWRIVSQGEFWLFEVTPGVAVPISDSVMRVYTALGQPIAFNDDADLNTLMSKIGVYLPPGVFYVEVGRYDNTSGGDYTLLMSTTTPPAGPVITNGQSRATAIPAGSLHQILVLESRVDIRINNRSSGDLSVVVQALDGTVVFYNDDSSTSNPDPAVDFSLPGGQYYMTCYEIWGGATTYDLSWNVTQQQMSDLCVTPFVTGNIIGDQTVELYRLDLSASAQGVSFATSGSGGNQINDTVLVLYDRDLRLIAWNDDDAFTAYSTISAELPAGTYFVGVKAYAYQGYQGSYTLTSTCGLPFSTRPIQWGRNPGIFAGTGQAITYALDVCTDVSASFSIDSYDCVSVLDSNGRLISGSIDIWDEAETSARLPAGQNFVIAWEPYVVGNGFWLEITPPLNCTYGRLQSRGKAGDAVAFVASLNRVPAYPLLPFIPGMLCLGPLIPIGSATIPSTGFINWTTNCPTLGVTVYTQQVDIFGTGWTIQPQGLGKVRNMLILK